MLFERIFKKYKIFQRIQIWKNTNSRISHFILFLSDIYGNEWLVRRWYADTKHTLVLNSLLTYYLNIIYIIFCNYALSSIKLYQCEKC